MVSPAGSAAMPLLSRPAALITFEGVEGAGKSTQAALLAERLQAAGRAVTRSREPGGSALGELLRTLTLHRAVSEGGTPVRIDPAAELLLMAAARAQHIDELIRPALEAGQVVILDRFSDSSVAYQGYGRGLALDLIASANAVATRGLTPDLTILLDLPAEDGLARRMNASAPDGFEREALAFHARVREGFRALATAEPGRWLVLDARLPPAALAAQIWARVSMGVTP